MKEREFGGCLWPDILSDGEDYYQEYENNKIEVDSGRSAIQYIIEKYSYNRIWLPVYNCPLVYERIQRISDIEVKFYNLNEDFSPGIKEQHLRKGDVFLWVNYCGVMQDELIDAVAALRGKTDADVIIDNIPALFSRPRMNVFNIYSCRKFIGVPDGGYLIGGQVKKEKLETYYTADNYLYLLKAMEKGSNSAYLQYQQSERRITEEDTAYGMPDLTKGILRSIDYKRTIEARKKNFEELNGLLGDRNRLCMNFNPHTPLVYPYLARHKGLRQRLLDRKVYVSRFWKHVLTNRLANSFEKDLAEYLIPLPIDQRYEKDDMTALGNLVVRLESSI